MALYRLLRIGVLRTDTQQRILPQSGDLWMAYLAWLKAGNVPDPYQPAVPPAETLAQAKARKLHTIKAAGLQRMQGRFPGLQTFDTVSLLREVILSIAPGARALTPDMQWLGDTYVAGKTAADQVMAATTIPQVDAVTPAWPAP
jgi:hypothetical protein